MTKLLSDLNSSLTYVTTPQSPQLAGSMVNAATDNVSNWLANGWLECDGSAVSRTTYADLFANTGTKYGIGDGSTTFNLPDGPRRTVEVDLSFSSTPTGWSLIKAIGLAYQTALGEWRLSFNVTATATASTNLAATLHGVFSTTTWSISNAESIAIGGRAFFGSSNITITTTSSQVNFIVSGDVSLDSKPTDDFVLADSRFSTFDEALESIPLVKAYDDSATGTAVSIAPATASRLGTVQLSSAYGAGDGVWGFVQSDKTQTKQLGSNVTTASTDVIVFNNLTVGQRYVLTGTVGATGSIAHIDIVENTTVMKKALANTTGTNSIPIEYEFVASETTVKLRTNSSWNGTVFALSGGVNCTWARLKWLRNNTIETTDFT